MSAEELKDLSLPTNIDDKFEIDKDDNGGEVQLGEGRFSTVYLGHSLHSKELKVAIKVLVPYKIGNKQGENVAQRESVAEMLNHINVIRILHKKFNEVKKDLEGKSETYTVLQIIMEFCEYSLVSFIKKTTPSFEGRLQLMLQLAKAVKYLHDVNIVHRDIKPENILIKLYSKSSVLKLTDFGLTERLPDITTKLTQRVGTKPWMAPEIYNDSGEGYGFPVDIYAEALVFLATMVCHNTETNKCNIQYCNVCRKLCIFHGKCNTTSRKINICQISTTRIM